MHLAAGSEQTGSEARRRHTARLGFVRVAFDIASDSYGLLKLLAAKFVRLLLCL